MGSTSFNDITKWKLLPVDIISITVNSNMYTWYRIEDDVSGRLASITSPNDQGGNTIVAHAIEITFSPAENKMDDYRVFLQDMKGRNPSEVDIYLSTDSLNDPVLSIETDAASVTVKDWSGFEWELAMGGVDSRAQFKLTGIFSVDLINATTPKLFTEANY